jgi:hypothetical protein
VWFGGMVNCSHLVWLFILLLVLPFCLAENFYAKDVLSDLKVACVNNGSSCGGGAVCNLSLVSPSGSLLVDNEAMGRSGEFFNYSINLTSVGDSLESSTPTDLEGLSCSKTSITLSFLPS